MVLRNILPRIIVLFDNVKQPIFHFLTPNVLAQVRVNNITEPFSHLKLAFYNHLMGNISPLLFAKMLQKYNQHHCLPNPPSSCSYFWVYSVMKLVIDLFKSSTLNKLANLFPILFVDLLFHHNELFLLFDIRSFGKFWICIFIVVQPCFVDLNS